MRYLFDHYAFDTDRRELHRGQDVVSVAPKVFDLLEYLIRNRERVVSKDDVIKAVWKGRVVSDEALTTRLNAARGAIGDSGEKQHFIKTLPRKGFRFTGTVQETQDHPASAYAANGPSPNGGAMPSPLSTPPLSIVVLPFANLGGDPEQDYFVDGVTESLTTDLSRIRSSFVIARSSAFSYKGRAIDVRQVGRELNVRYVLEGSVQRGGRRLRVNVQLIDAENGSHLWAERFEKPVADLFDMQDEIVSRLANTLGTQLVVAEARRAERSQHPDALDLVFQGFACVYKAPTPEHMTQAQGFFERALAIDPQCAEALVGAAIVDLTMVASQFTDDGTTQLAAAETAAFEAVSLAPNYALAHSVLGVVYILTNRALQGIIECDRALALDRNLADAHGIIGLAKYFMGRAAETEGHVVEALRLSLRDARAFRWMFYVGAAKLQVGADAEAADWLRRSIEANRHYALAHFCFAAALGLLGILDEARKAANAGLALDPDFSIRRWRTNRPSSNPTFVAGLERLQTGFRLAGVPEG